MSTITRTETEGEGAVQTLYRRTCFTWHLYGDLDLLGVGWAGTFVKIDIIVVVVVVVVIVVLVVVARRKVLFRNAVARITRQTVCRSTEKSYISRSNWFVNSWHAKFRLSQRIRRLRFRLDNSR